jgi:hypothetical protein
VSELAKALAKAQSEFPAIERSRDVKVQTKTGGSYTFAYAPHEEILKKVQPVLSANGLAVSQLLANVQGAPALKTMLMHEGGEVIADTCPLPTNGQTTAQEFGSLVTYMRRYALVAVLGIATEEDDDGNHASGNTATRSGAGTPLSGSTAPAPGTKFSEARPNMTHEEYLALVEIAQLPKAVPSQQVISFGKNKGMTLGELTKAQLRWYAEDWEIQADPSPYDIRMKSAAKALHAGDDSSDFDIPF